MCTEMLCTNWKGQRDDTSRELAKSKTYADGNCESVTTNSVFEIQRIILIGLLYLLYTNLIKNIKYTQGARCMKYKTVKEIKKEMEEDSELFASGIGMLILLGIYFIGMLLPYFIH